MSSTLDPIGIIKICAIGMVPLMVAVIWLLPKFLHSQRSTKMLVGAIVVSIYMVTTVILVDGSSLQIPNIIFVTALTAFIWGAVGFLMGAYFDVRLRMELGTMYYQKFPRLRMYGVEYGFVGAVISLPTGLAAGWLSGVFGASTAGLLLSMVMGILWGGFLGVGLAWYMGTGRC